MPVGQIPDELSNVLAYQLASDKLTKLVRKLRWIGREKEARRIQRILDDAVLAEASSRFRVLTEQEFLGSSRRQVGIRPPGNGGFHAGMG
jgi:hypothetical protein